MLHTPIAALCNPSPLVGFCQNPTQVSSSRDGAKRFPFWFIFTRSCPPDLFQCCKDESEGRSAQDAKRHEVKSATVLLCQSARTTGHKIWS